jgi:hypothetical protein
MRGQAVILACTSWHARAPLTLRLYSRCVVNSSIRRYSRICGFHATHACMDLLCMHSSHCCPTLLLFFFSLPTLKALKDIVISLDIR